ncbi:FeoB small GTPase domain-containing protein [Crocosphaera sp. XPORK-15E]|uniref:FeoB small GTPase domain-containing protein n=1 Tax=Crocosphaera sp. XPORK-15E TaxID=3110247 RepID=UPI002B1FD791|nr:FeoB small GTPase domain-containing protein [Crocosphaera sp. XPORK-15E]MEA5533400.1 FeoB small GTPase domain-containing protein [Crocosphaera sp. XPORK-15E]
MKCNKCPDTCQNTTTQSNSYWQKFLPPNLRKESPKIPSQATFALVGSPNVGKSLLFSVLTGTYTTVSNYPGTTVEVSRSQTIIEGKPVTIIDTPGMYSLTPMTEEERFSRELLFQDNLDVAIHVIDAKNLNRMLSLTFQLMETQIPVILAVNMVDEAEKLGIWVNEKQLEASLGIPVVTLSAAQKRGIQSLTAKMANYDHQPALSYSY